MQWSHQIKKALSCLAKMGTHLSNFGYSLTCSSKYTGHQSPFFNMEHPSPVGLRCSWSRFLLEMEVKLDSVSVLSLCFFPDSFKGNPSETAEPVRHCLLQWETGALCNFGHCAHTGKGHALRIVASSFSATPKFISTISHTFTLLPVTLISQELKISDIQATQNTVAARCTDACRTY